MIRMETRAGSPRRELATRRAAWPRSLAHALALAGVRPNAVSIASVIVACLAAAAYAIAPGTPPTGRVVLLVSAAAAIQLRLLCNLLDGMLAVEEGLKTPTGEIYNDFPDRIADVVILVAAGYSIRGLAAGPALGWLAATLALLTAYVRVLGGSIGLTQHFIGPMAKQHRMFVLTVATLGAAAESLSGLSPRAIAVGLAVIAAGSFVTLIRRTHRILIEARGR